MSLVGCRGSYLWEPECSPRSDRGRQWLEVSRAPRSNEATCDSEAATRLVVAITARAPGDTGDPSSRLAIGELEVRVRLGKRLRPAAAAERVCDVRVAVWDVVAITGRGCPAAAGSHLEESLWALIQRHLRHVAASNRCDRITFTDAGVVPPHLTRNISAVEAQMPPEPPRCVLDGTVTLRLARDEDRKGWNELVVRSSGHNLGGWEMVAATFQATFKIVAVDVKTDMIVGLASVTSSGWMPYLSALGHEGEGLGSFLLHICLEWCRLRGISHVSLSPATRQLIPWYARWGFDHTSNSVKPLVSSKYVYRGTSALQQARCAAGDVVMERPLTADRPLLPKSIFHYVRDLQQEMVSQPNDTELRCVMCYAHQIDSDTPAVDSDTPAAIYSTLVAFRKHLERHLMDGNVPQKRACAAIGVEWGWSLCTLCGVRFDIDVCGVCRVCWAAEAQHGEAAAAHQD